jgi:RNA polymerase sigma-70 factor (ECF subfamily)
MEGLSPKPAQDPDAAAVAAAQAGDGQAFAHLIEKLHVRVYRYILRQAPTVQDAEDLTQETFLEAHRNLKLFRGASRFSTWVMGIAHNLVRNRRRRSLGRLAVETPLDHLENLADDRPGPHADIQMHARLKALRRGMETFLTPDLRDALALVSLEELSYEEAAMVLDIPLGTLKTRVFRARQRLLDGLRNSGEWELFERV